MTPRDLHDVHDESSYGGKAVQLGHALRAGFPVPSGFALSVRLVETLAKGEVSAREAVHRLYDGFGHDSRVAARSSAVGEDSATASFAGQHLTRLNVCSAAELAAAVVEVWSSGRTESALAYRARLGIGGPPRVAVVVQTMIAPTCAGVLFTRNPVTGADERVIEATWGLGEAVVAGLVTPDRFRLARGGDVLERSAGEKDIAVRATPDGDTAEVAVEPERVHALCLDDEMLAALETLAARCELHFDGAHDVEWAFEERTLYLLQRRSITR